MAMIDALTIVVALFTAALMIVSSWLSPGNTQQMIGLVDGNVPLTFLCIWTLGCLPLAFAMPRLRASFFGPQWHLPSGAYALPRWIVRFCVGAAFGQAVGFTLLAVVQDHQLIWFAGALAFIGVALWAGARARLREPAANDWTMPWCRWPWR